MRVLLILLGLCSLIQTTTAQVSEYPDMLDIRGVPDSTKDPKPFAFFDLGAWHGYALPAQTKPECIGGFPVYTLTQDNGRWLSRGLARFSLSDETGLEYFNNNTEFESHYLPDRLIQIIQTKNPGIKVQIELTYLSDRTALISTQIINTSSKTILLNATWEGSFLLKNAAFKKTSNNSVQILFNKNGHCGNILFSKKAKITFSKNQYKAQITHRINTGESLTHYHTESICFNKNELAKQINLAILAFENPEEIFNQNRKRWDEYLNKSLKGIQEEKQRQLAVKCVETLISNWRSPAGELLHSGLFPSWHYRGFQGFWAWDSWKHAAALAHFAPQLAKEQIRAMFDFQAADGMIPDCIFRDTFIEKHNWRDTKPPLAAWAVWEIYEQTQDLDFLKEIFPKLEKYHQWWYAYRDNDGNGLCEYGSTDGSLEAAKWESGMDNAVRFDSAQMRKNPKGGWSLNQESVDLNAFLAQEKHLLTQMEEALGESNNIYHLARWQQLNKKIQAAFYDADETWFFDIRLDNKIPIKVKGSEGWVPLFTLSASPQQAKQMIPHLLDPSQFGTYVPFPTLAANHPALQPEDGYWRGPVWIDQAYFAYKGLINYGYKTEAAQLRNQLLNHAEGLLDSPLPICENYNPHTGKCLEARNFSWSAACLLLMLWE